MLCLVAGTAMGDVTYHDLAEFISVQNVHHVINFYHVI